MTGHADPAEGRIVVGVDGTTTSAVAVRWAVQEALLRRASVHLVFADDHDRRRRAPYASLLGTPGRDEVCAAGTALLAVQQLASQTLPPDRLSAELADGPAAQVLIDRSVGAELLVLGRAYQAGQSASDTWPPMGPVARACLQGAACPLVVMGPCA